MKLPILGSIIFTIVLFWLGLNELAIINIILFIIQIIGGLIFDIEPRDFLFILCIIGVIIILFLQFVLGIDII